MTVKPEGEPEGEASVECEDEEMTWSNGSTGIDLLKFKNFYDQIDFSPGKRLVITKAIIELTEPSGSSNVVESKRRRNNRFNDNAVVFHENDRHNITSQHNCPLYMIVKVRDVELKGPCWIEDHPSISSPYILDTVRVPRENITKQSRCTRFSRRSHTYFWDL